MGDIQIVCTLEVVINCGVFAISFLGILFPHKIWGHKTNVNNAKSWLIGFQINEVLMNVKMLAINNHYIYIFTLLSENTHRNQSYRLAPIVGLFELT